MYRAKLGLPMAMVMATAVLCASTTTLFALPEEPPSSPSRSQLFVSLSEALESFDLGSGLLNSAPDAALAAFREARDKFQSVVDAGVENGMLYYNLGNTHLRLGEIGKSIADYRRAARLMPSDEQLKANLRFARSLRRDQIKIGGERAFLQTVFLWHYSIPIRTRLAAALALYALFWILLTLRMTAGRFRLGYAIILCLVLWIGLGSSVAIELPTHGRSTAGVLIANDVVVRKGNGEGYASQFEQPLHEGVEFTILEQRGGWMHIELTDGNSGWVRQREVELF